MKAAFLVALLSFGAGAEDRPVVLRLPDGSLQMSPDAAKALDAELRRLQVVEKQHKDEKWLLAIAVATAIGVAAGAGVVLAVNPPRL